MAAHRYWRTTGIVSYGGSDLELSEFQLLAAGVRVDGPATLTASAAPAVGAVSDLKDGATTSVARWAAADVPSLVLSWDFGSGGDVDVTDIRLGSSTLPARFLLSATIQWSDDALAWTTSKVVPSAAWPGPSTLTLSTGGGAPYWRANAYSIPAGSVSAIPITLPSNLQPGSLLLVGVNYRGTPTAVPVGWTAISTSAVGSPSGQNSVVYSKVATDADSGSVVTFSQTTATTGLSAYMIELASFNGTPVVDQTATGMVNGVPSTAISVLTSGGDARMAVVYGSTTTAFSSTTATVDLTPASASEWISRTVQNISDLRGAFFTRGLNNGGTTAGTLSSAGSSGSTSFTWNAFLFVASAGILQNRAGRTRMPLVNTAGSLAVTGITAYGNTRTAAIYRARKDYINTQFGQGIGRLRGTTKDKGTPNVPVSERVRLYRMRDGLLLREVFSTPGTGAYSFDYIDETETYFVISFDHDLAYRAVVADNLNLANGGVELIA